jgi:UDP:flavonoid glycosyltransferase YjiC (YdhE family)
LEISKETSIISIVGSGPYSDKRRFRRLRLNPTLPITRRRRGRESSINTVIENVSSYNALGNSNKPTTPDPITPISSPVPHFIITALGSYGDVHPMVGLGRALADRGHRVQIVANPYFDEVLHGAGLELLPFGTRDEYVYLTQHPDLWHPIRGPKLVLGLTAARIDELYELLVSHYVPGETVYGAHALDLASRVARETIHAPVASIDYAPAMFWSVYDSPRMKGPLLGPSVPKWLKRAQYWLADTVAAQRLLGRDLNQLRNRLGLPPARLLFSHWMHTTDLTLCLFPDWFGPPQPDWPINVRMAGFPLWDSSAESQLCDEVLAFLSAGPPPIAFSPGSANREAQSFFTAAVEACERLGRRGILLTKYADQLPANLPRAVRHFGFVPLSKLLPHTAALVHHGGIGTCAQGLAAGVPQVVQPMSYDQFDNAQRLVRLGVANEVSVRRFRGPAVASALALLLDSPKVAARCGELAARCNGSIALATACDALESLTKTKSHTAGVSTPSPAAYTLS